ncbi:M23 family metallopeptidase [Photobacterium damselae]|uniref:M23 family metallopeptidase n=1 Tax=Photobacterium damselae TaxID=38293 RepID=UPI0015A0446C|nr:M23 family metallopeptidase [Photobacterium damselae]NVO62621.1 M23 family metallopeptidase [Photobacterium damselae subsp. damselae]
MSKANKSVNNKAPIRKLKQEKPRDNKPLIMAGAGFCGALFALLCYGAFTLYQDAYDNNQQLDLLNRQAQELAASLNEESEMNQKLNAELESKNESLEHLNQRLDDMETVLGLQTDGENPYTLEQRIDSAAIDSAVRATLFRLIPNGMPTPEHIQLTSGFGTRVHPITKKRRSHNGLDFAAKIGTPIYAPADAVIEQARSSNSGYGNHLQLNHAMGFISTYSHLSKFNVKRGQFVRKGDLIGWTGNTGLSTGPHLHYEIRFLGRPLNPKAFVKWTPENFDSLFAKEKSVQWASLLNMINGMVGMQVQLTYDDSTKGLTTAQVTHKTSEQDENKSQTK